MFERKAKKYFRGGAKSSANRLKSILEVDQAGRFEETSSFNSLHFIPQLPAARFFTRSATPGRKFFNEEER